MMKKTKLQVREEYRKKEACLAEADRIIEEKLIDGMDRMEIAREIYFHARVYRFCQKTHCFAAIREHADPIELDDSGDTLFRRLIYRLTWMV